MREIEVTRKIEFDAGHRIPNHGSKCRNIHGHRYVLEATLASVPNPLTGASDEAMVMDFGDLKAIMMRAVGDRWDHALLVSVNDTVLRNALEMFDGQVPFEHKTVLLDCVSTVENLVVEAAGLIMQELGDKAHLLRRVRLYETPNCWADWTSI